MAPKPGWGAAEGKRLVPIEGQPSQGHLHATPRPCHCSAESLLLLPLIVLVVGAVIIVSIWFTVTI